jgi:TPR repeat protein
MKPAALRTLVMSTLAASVVTVGSLPSRAQSVRFDETTPLDTVQAHAARGNSSALLELGERMLQGRGMAADSTEGLKLMHKSADAGYSQAWYDLGVVYANAMGVTIDMTRAMVYFHKGASAGNADCQCSLGLMYQAGERIPGGVKADPAEARKWYRLAADQGHEEAIMHLGQLLMWGQGGPEDPEGGAKLFRQGSEAGNPEAQWSLGQCYLKGKGVAQDSVQAYGLFAAAAAGVSHPEQKKGMGDQKEMLGKALSKKQLAEGERLADEWKSRRHQP